MKRIFSFCLVLVFSSTLWAQYYGGVTGILDTSYSTYSAFINTKRDYPDIKIVGAFISASVKEKRSVKYASIGKRELFLDVFQPAQNGNRIAFIMIHGGGWRSGNRAQHHPLAQHLASLGYTCFTPEYRLSTEALFPAAVYDVKAAIRWVRENAVKLNIDPGKIVIGGFSAGGELAAFMGTTGNMPLFEGMISRSNTGSHANAVVDIDGTLAFHHPEGREGDDNKKLSASTLWFGYKKVENPMLIQAASPLSWVSARTPPTLFLNSSVPWMHAGRDEYMKVLSDNSIYSEMHTFEGAPHSFCLFEPWFEPTVSYIDGFLKKVFNLK